MAYRRDQCVTQRDTPVPDLGNVVVPRPWPEVRIVLAAAKIAFYRSEFAVFPQSDASVHAQVRIGSLGHSPRGISGGLQSNGDG
jgi:hypothetical protein